MRKIWPAFLAILASAAFALSVFNRLPEQVVSHWGADGTPDGWMSRGAMVIEIHCIMFVIAAVLALAPALTRMLGPTPNNFELHAGSYWLVVNASLVFVAGATIAAVGMNLGWKFHVEWLRFALGLLLMTIGNVMTRARPNWIFGVRTSWTLSSDKSWRATNRAFGYGFVILGLLSIVATAIRPTAMVRVLTAGSIAISFVSLVVSYIVWKNDPLARHE
ncbi:MAG: SdpI family protein [Gemmatimonadaceae bacterium]